MLSSAGRAYNLCTIGLAVIVDINEIAAGVFTKQPGRYYYTLRKYIKSRR